MFIPLGHNPAGTLESEDHRLADTDLRHGLNHHAFIFLVAQGHGVIGIGVKENGIIVVWVATKLPAKGLKLALDGLPCFRRQGMRRDRWAMTFLQPQPDS
jgi:hypothetical protein